jgi:hypothetical protein
MTFDVEPFAKRFPRALLRPQGWICVPVLELSLKQHLVIGSQPSVDRFFSVGVLFADQVDGSFGVYTLRRNVEIISIWICLVMALR